MITLYAATQAMHEKRNVGQDGRWAFRTPAAALASWNRGYAWNAETTATEQDIEAVTVALPDWAIWQGDTISVELHRGGIQDEDGIHSGGAWHPTVGYADIDMIWLSPDGTVTCIMGCLCELGSDRHLQTMNMRQGERGYACRGAKVLRRRDPTLESGGI